MDAAPAAVALAIAAALHLGFQLTVTTLVYPALARVPAASWTDAHDRHSRTITPVVGVAYGALVVTSGWELAADRGAWSVAAVVAFAVVLVVTGALAAPTHGRLTRPDPALLRHLLVVDRLRLVGAVACAVLAVVALL